MKSSDVLKYLNTPSKAILSLHRRPDGDSLGSNLALYHVLKGLGHDVTVTSIDPVPEFLSFLKDSDIVVVQSPLDVHWHDYETYWALDTAAADMIGETVSFPPKLTIINIDHHRTNTKWGSVNLVDPDAISCSSVLYDFFKENDIKFTKDTAFALLLGLCTDSGFFNYINDGKPLKMGGDLIDSFQLNYQEIIFNIMRQTNIEDVIFMGQALSKMTVNFEKKAVIIPIPYTSELNYDTVSAKSHMLMNYLQSINGTEFGILIIE